MHDIINITKTKNIIAIIYSVFTMSESFNIEINEALSVSRVAGQNYVSISKNCVVYYVDFNKYTIGTTAFNETIQYKTAYERSYFTLDLIGILVGETTFKEILLRHNNTQ